MTSEYTLGWAVDRAPASRSRWLGTYGDQRLAAAFFAISDRWAGVSAFALARAPLLPARAMVRLVGRRGAVLDLTRRNPADHDGRADHITRALLSLGALRHWDLAELPRWRPCLR